MNLIRAFAALTAILSLFVGSANAIAAAPVPTPELVAVGADFYSWDADIPTPGTLLRAAKSF